jgi:hypothetical protein
MVETVSGHDGSFTADAIGYRTIDERSKPRRKQQR